MRENPEKSVRYVAAGYGLFAAFYFVLGGVLTTSIGGYVSVLSPHPQDTYIVNATGTVVSILGVGLLNVVLALCAWWLFALHKMLRLGVLVIASAIAIFLLVSNAVGIVSWYPSGSRMIGFWYATGGSLLFAVGYLVLAWALIRAGRTRVVAERAKRG